MAKMTQAQDDAYDKKHGIKEGSARDTKQDKKNGVNDGPKKIVKGKGRKVIQNLDQKAANNGMSGIQARQSKLIHK